jgi:hypothetical protein
MYTSLFFFSVLFSHLSTLKLKRRKKKITTVEEGRKKKMQRRRRIPGRKKNYMG